MNLFGVIPDEVIHQQAVDSNSNPSCNRGIVRNRIFLETPKIMERFGENLHLIYRVIQKGALHLSELEGSLIRRCQAGDKEAFRVLVEMHSKILFGTAYLMTRDRGLAEDAVQEALVKVWKHLPSLRLQGSFKSWLLRIVINEV
jgi:hypothetical protein